MQQDRVDLLRAELRGQPPPGGPRVAGLVAALLQVRVQEERAEGEDGQGRVDGAPERRGDDEVDGVPLLAEGLAQGVELALAALRQVGVVDESAFVADVVESL